MLLCRSRVANRAFQYTKTVYYNLRNIATCTKLSRAMENIFYPPEGLPTTYPRLLRFLYGINDKLKADGIQAPTDASLTNTKTLYELIGRPLDKIPTVHIGGTNGKGSTSFKVSEALRAAGIRTGLFVSPHLASFRERMQVNAELISEEAFLLLLPRVLELCAKHSIPATLFEIIFILSCLHFEREHCEAVVLEVGLGGELDATNVVSTALSMICSVSLDHTRILGSTVEEIAIKKAGIFKQNVPALVGPGCPMEVMRSMGATRSAPLYTLTDLLRQLAQDHKTTCIPESYKDAPLEVFLKDLEGCGGSGVCTGSNERVVDTDELNTQLSFAALCLLINHNSLTSTDTPTAVTSAVADTRNESSLTSSASLDGPLMQLIRDKLDPMNTDVQQALRSRPPCRWEIRNVSVTLPTSNQSTVDTVDAVNVTAVLDVGHNPAAVRALTRRIKQQFPGRNVRLLYAMSRDKDVRTCLKEVLNAIPHDKIHFAQSKYFRAISKEKLSELFKEETGHEYTHLDADGVKETVAEVLQLAASESRDSVVVICGTGYIMPDAREQLGIKEPRDDYDLKRED